MENATFRRWTTAFWLLLAAGAVATLAVRLVSLVVRGPEYVTTGFEDVCIFKIDRIRFGDPYYSDCFSYPYRGSFYNWFFHASYGIVATILDPSERTLPTVLRLVTLAWTLVACVASWRFLHQFRPAGDNGPPPDRVVIGAQVLVTWLGPFLGWWTMTTRPDVPGVVCQALGFFLMARDDRRPTLGRAVAAGVCFFLGWSFKQSEVFLLTGTVLALLTRREWRAAVTVSTVFAALVAVVLLVADPAYYINIFEAPKFAPWELRQLQMILYAWQLTGGILLVLLPALLAFCIAPPRARLLQSPAVRTAAVAFAVTLPLNVIACGRAGSSPNYFFESWVAGMTLIGLLTRDAFAHLPAFATPGHRAGYGGVLGVLLTWAAFLTIGTFQPFHKPVGWPTEFMLWLPADPYPAELLDAVRTSPRPLLCDDSFLARQALGADAGDLPILEHTIYWDALLAGRIQDGGVTRRIDERAYGTLWLDARHSRWEEPALKAGYVLREQRDGVKRYDRP